MFNNLKNIGKKFGLLTQLNRFRKGKCTYAEYLCECGVSTIKLETHVLSGRTTSCGCLLKFNHLAHQFTGTHGQSKTKEFRAWQAMQNRCYNKKYKYFSRYGGRGIFVCKEWLGSSGFGNFLSDIGYAPSKLHTLDRFPNNDGNYENGNVRWATWKQQQQNTSRTRMIKYKGETKTLSDWSELIGISVSWLHRRLKRGDNIKQIIEYHGILINN